MSDELDKFVLSYEVKTNDGEKKLSALKEKMDEAKKAADSGKEGFKEFASGAADELGKVIPVVDKVSTAVRAMAADFGIAATAILAVGAAVKSVGDLRDMVETQRRVGMDAGVSPIRAENYRRQFQRVSQGRVDEQKSNDTIKQIGEFGMRAYQDPTRVNSQEARILKMMGLSIGNGRRAITPTKDLIANLATQFSTMSPAEVQGTAKVMGIDPDAALAMQKLGGSMGKITDLSAEDVKKREGAQDNITELNTALSNLNEKLRETEVEVGSKIVPAFTKLADVLAKIAGFIPGTVDRISDATGTKEGESGMVGTALKRTLAVPALAWDAFKRVTGYGTTTGHGHPHGEDPTPVKAADTQKAAAESNAKVADANAKSADQLVEANEAQNKDARQFTGQMGLAVNMFAGAVASFSNAIDERQAWAAWAGEIGRASGLGSDPSSDKSRGAASLANGAMKSAYDDIFEAAARKYDIPINLLKAHAKVESGFNPNAVSGAGAQGIMQLIPSTAKGLGVTDPFDPKQSIMGGAQLIRQNLDHYGGDVNKSILAYHGGYDESQWGPKTRAYLSNVSSAAGGGESRDKVALRAVQQNIANRLGVPLAQIQQGGVNRGDVQFANSQLKAGVENGIFNLQKELAYEGLPQQQRSKIMTDIQSQQRGLAQLQTYGSQVEGAAQPGDRSITIGERAIIINVNGAENPDATANAVGAHLSDHIGDIVTGSASGVKY